MSDELSRRRLGAVPNQPAASADTPTGWRHHGSSAEPPLDMNAVHADEEFLEALAHDMPVATADDAEYQLAALLTGWRHELLSEPTPEFPSVDDVERAIVASQPRPARKAIRHLRLASGAAAVVIVAMAALTVLSQGAAPGDPLWGVKKVVFSEQAIQTQAATDAQSNLELAEEALARGEFGQAQALCDQAVENLKPVRDEETRKKMDKWLTRLRASVPPTTVSKTKAPTAASTTKPVKPTDPATLPPDIRNQLRSSQATVPPVTDDPTTQPETPDTSEETTPSTTTPVPTPRPTSRPGVPTLPPLSIRPN